MGNRTEGVGNADSPLNLFEFEPLNLFNLEPPPPPPPPPPPQETLRRAEVEQTGAHRRAQLEARLDQQQQDTSGAPISQTPPLTGEEKALADRLQSVQRVNDITQQAWAQLPPDTRPVGLRADANVSFFDQWKTGARPALGNGDVNALDDYFDQNRSSLDALGRILNNEPPRSLVQSGMAAFGYDQQALTEQLYAPSIAGLKRLYPDASIELVALKSGTLDNSLQQLPFAESEIVIALTRRDADGIPSTQYLSPDIPALINPDNNPRIVQALQQAGVADQWYAKLKTITDGNPALQSLVGADAQATLGDGNRNSGLMSSLYGPRVALDAILQMNRQDQAAFFAAYSQGAPSVLGGFLTSVELKPEQTIVRADAGYLAGGTGRPSAINTQVNIAGADNTNKLSNFIEQNYQTVIAPTFAQYLELRGDEPRELSGTSLSNEIGMAMNMPPNNAPQTPEQEAAFNNGTWEFYTGEARDTISPVEEAIRNVAGGDDNTAAKVTVLPVMFDSKETGLVQVPLFRVAGQDGEDHFVDNTGRTYSSFEDWKDNNKLPAGRISYAADGHLTGADGRANIVTENSHAVIDTFGERAVWVLDKVALVGGVVLAGAAIIGTGGAATPFVIGGGIAVSAWGAGRAGDELLDRYNHGQTLSPTDSSARGAWLGFGANVVGLAALGASARVASAVARGAEVEVATTRLATTLNVAAQYTDTAAIGNLGYNLAVNWDNLTTQERMTQVAQMAFWGGMMTHSARQAGGVRNLYGAADINSFMTQSRQQFADARLARQERVWSTGKPIELTAAQANAPHLAAGRQPPYAEGTIARDITLNGERTFVRVHGETNQARSWLMRPEDIQGLTAQQIQDKFALPELPLYVSDVHVPAGTRIRVGIVGEQPGWGKGGAIQYELQERIPTTAFNNRRSLP